MSFTATDVGAKRGGTDTWLTPLEYIEAAGGDFDLDPCAYPTHNTAKQLISLPIDGFNSIWHGKVWLNPPYSDAGRWVNKLAEHGHGVALVFARTDTRWLNPILAKADYVQFIKRRVRFLRADKKPATQPSTPSILIFFGCKPKDLSLGTVMTPEPHAKNEDG